MYPVNADKERIIQIVSQWLARSGLGIEQVIARMQINGYDIARSTFENRFTTRVQQKPNIPPDCFLALITALTERLTDDERCTASEAIEMANLARLPIDQFQDIQQLFPHDEFITAFEQYILPLFGQTHLLKPPEQPNTQVGEAVQVTLHNEHPPGNSPSSYGHNSQAHGDVIVPLTEEWGDSPDVASFFGRTEQIDKLGSWITRDRCRLIAILAIGGMGKTTLAKKVAEYVREDFDCLYWTSLRDAPSMDEVVDDCISFLTSQLDAESIIVSERRTARLLQLLRQKRALLIFDGAEAIMQERIDAGGYLDGFEEYAELFQLIGETTHNSCLVITSREKPEELAIMDAASSPVRSLPLLGLDVDSARQVLHDKGLHGEDDAWRNLVATYSGNPLALKLASEPISEVFGGEIKAFLKGGIPVVTGVRDLLDAHFSRLTLLERSVLNWLTVEREALPPDALLDNLSGSVTETQLLEALRWLRRRSLIEQNASGLTLQNVVMEYMAERFVGLVVDEILANFPTLLNSFTLMKAEAKEYIRKSQIALFVGPIVDNLIRRVGESETAAILLDMLQRLRETRISNLQNNHADSKEQSYQAGNILNLLIHMGVNLEGAALSHLQIQHVDLRGITLRDADISYADCSHSIFKDTFGSITSVAFSPDGSLLVVGDAGGDVRLWDVASLRQLNAFSGHTDLIWSVALSMDGQTIASCGQDQTIRLWDINSNECLGILRGHEGWVKEVAFTHDGAILGSCSNDGTLRLWDVDSHNMIAIIEAHDGWLWSVAVSPDDSLVATSGHDGLVKVWDIATRSCIQQFVGHTGPVRTVRFSPDGRWVASGSVDHSVRLWDIETGEMHLLTGHKNQVWTIAFSPNGDILASGGDDQTLRLWRMDTRKPLSTLQGNPSRIWTTAFSPDGNMLVSGSDDLTLRFWDVATGQATQIVEGFSNQVWSVDYAPETNFAASAGDDKHIYLWEFTNIQPHEGKSEGELSAGEPSDLRQPQSAPLVPIILPGHTERVRSLAFSADGQVLVSGGDDHLVRIWDCQSHLETDLLAGHTNRVWSVAISQDTRMIASSSEDQTIRLWRYPSGRCFRIIPVNHRIWSVAFSPDNQLLASASDDSLIRLWSISNGDVLQTLSGHYGRVWSVAFRIRRNSPDQNGNVKGQAKMELVSGGDDGFIRIWDVENGELLQTLSGHEDGVSTIACASDGMIVSGSEDHCIRIWDPDSGECLQIIDAHEGSVRSVVFGPGETVFSGGSDERLRQWMWKQGALLLDQRTDRPYERMNISNLSGVSAAQMDTLRLLGAVEENT